jgi:hypothetical protein
MAFSECGNHYDLFAKNPRCRQPPLAALLALLAFIGSISAAIFGKYKFPAQKQE